MLVFARDWDKGKKICQALATKYISSLVFYEKEDIGEILKKFDFIVGVMAVGILVRSICGHIKDKWSDTPVVALDSALSCAVPVIGGHHGANELAKYLATQLNLFPAITTATDSKGKKNLEFIANAINAEIINKEVSKELNLTFLRQDVAVLRLKGPKIVVIDQDVAVLKTSGLIVGLGTRRGVKAQEVLDALDAALQSVGRKREEIGTIVTAWLKREEIGITEAAKSLGKEVIYLDAEILNIQKPITDSRAIDIGLKGVAEPAVLAIATKLIMPKKVFGRVTIAIGE
ncbi:MAG: cobalt-precorrin 5A hydrolase [Methanotrichaceae archaeon]|nr:cobalt-precorrin 5A hydrolase [Methanotrichaceae archaeon]